MIFHSYVSLPEGISASSQHATLHLQAKDGMSLGPKHLWLQQMATLGCATYATCSNFIFLAFFFWNPYCEEVHIGSRIQKVSLNTFWGTEMGSLPILYVPNGFARPVGTARKNDVMAAELSLNLLGISCVIHKLHDLHGCVTSRGAT